jgi:hypothetical protein
MPHNNNGQIYRTTSGGVEKAVTDPYVSGDIGVDPEDVSAVLGNSSGDVGTLCKDPGINKWSKRKPVSYPNEMFKLTDDQLKEINYGLSVPAQIDLLPLQTLYSNLNGANGESLLDAAYSYTKPTGGTLASPCRLLDFEKYYHHAQAPIGVTSQGGHFAIEVSTQMTVYQFSFIMNTSGSESEIGLRDLSTDFDNFYLFLAVLKDGVWYLKTAIRPVTNALGGYITLNSTDLNSVIEQEVARTCIVGLCRRGDNLWSDYLTQGRGTSVIFYYPPMRSAAGCIGTIKYTAAGGFSASLKPNYVTGTLDGKIIFVSGTMQIRVGHNVGSEIASVTFDLTLTGTNSTDPSLDGKIYENSTYVNSITWNQAKTSCTLVGTITGPWEIGSSGYIDIPVNGAIFRTTTQDLTTSGTVRIGSATFNVYDGGGWVPTD